MEKSQKIELQVINAFVDNDKGGNSAGAVNADRLNNVQKLKITDVVLHPEFRYILACLR